jgi:putative spermidine/putrescine transport system ATP-binding protein
MLAPVPGTATATNPSSVRPTAAAPTARGLAFRGISKHYGPVRAVDGVDLDVARGEFLTLLGPSGSGKTTMLMMIAGFTAPSAGEILLDGRAITHLPPEKRNFGMVFQGYALFPHLSVFDNVAFPLKVRRRPPEEIKREVNRALELVQLTALADRMPRQLSGGQQQRVALARALVFTPDVLLLDEPLGALDRKLRTEVQIELKQLHERIGTTFVYVTHDQEEALSMSDRVAIVRDGRFVQIGRPADLYERPATRFVAGFLGESNFIKGRVSGTAEGGFTYNIGGETFRQKAAPAPTVGSDVLLAMRPEKIAIATDAASTAANRIQGRVTSWNYFGSDFHFTVATASLGQLAVRCPAWRMKLEPRNEMQVWLGWDADAAVVVADD